MREGGWGLVILGVLLILAGVLIVDVSVDVVYMPSISPYLPRMPSEVANLHAMHIQSLLVHGGLASIICGTLAIGFGALDERLTAMLETLSRRSRQSASSTVVQPTGEQVEALAEPAYEPATYEDEADNSRGFVLGFIIACMAIVLIIAAYATGSGDRDAYNAAVDNQALQDALDQLNELNTMRERFSR